MLLELDQLLSLAFLQPRNGNMGPARNNFGDIFFGYFLAQHGARHTGTSGVSDTGYSALGKLLFQFGDPSVLNLTRLGQFTASLRPLQLGALLFEFFFPLPLFLENGFLFLPFRLEPGRFFFQPGQFFFEFLEAFFAGRIFFLLERLSLHLALHNLALDHVDLGRHRLDLDLQTRCGFIDKVDRLIR